MGRDKKTDEIPMLSETQSQNSPRELEMNRSVSVCLPLGNNNVRRDVSFSGPLNTVEKSTIFRPFSGPLLSEAMSSSMLNAPSGRSRARIKPEERIVNSHAEEDDGRVNGIHEGRHEHLMRSGPLGRCNDPYCITCPAYYDPGGWSSKKKKNGFRKSMDYKVQNLILGNVRNGTNSFFSGLWEYMPGILSPHARIVQQWNKFFVISCLIAIFVDPLFFFLLSVNKDYGCIVLNRHLTILISVLRSVTDFVYLLHILLQFRLAYVAPESRIVGAGDLVDDPKEIAKHYLKGYFCLDIFVVLPLPQIMMLVVLPKYVGSSAANYAKNLLRVTVLLQYLPRMFRFIPLLAGSSETGLIFESAWANFVINLLIFVLAGHVVGSCWYLLALQRVNQCLRNACKNSADPLKSGCLKFIDCGHGEKNFKNDKLWSSWKNNANVSDCFLGDNSKEFTYGIYSAAVPVTTSKGFVIKYIYSLFWGFQQISTLAGNQTPSLFVWEVLFTMSIVGLGLLLFALLIGNMQNFLQSLGRRRSEMQLRRRDVELWMNRRRLPTHLRRRIRQSERFKWAANRGVNEEEMLENLPEDLQREIRRHLCLDLVKKVRIFTVMDDLVMDAICERLRQRLYIHGSEILRRDYPIDKMIFIVRGNLESIGKDSGAVKLSSGDICGEELLTWYLENTSIHKNGKMFKRTGAVALSSRTVRCVGSVEAFALQKTDLEEVTKLFSRMLRSPRVQGAIRFRVSKNTFSTSGDRKQLSILQGMNLLTGGHGKPPLFKYAGDIVRRGFLWMEDFDGYNDKDWLCLAYHFVKYFGHIALHREEV